MPDQSALRFWKIVADRYKDNPLVAFDLYNEPNGITPRVWRDGGTVPGYGHTYKAPGMQELYDVVRSTGADNLVFATTPNYGSTFPTGFELRDTRNLVYAAHGYTCPHATPEDGGICHPGPGGVLDPTGILSRFDAVATQVPVMLTEFGWPDPAEGRYNATAIRHVTEHQWVGWDVFVFDGGTLGAFSLVRSTAEQWQPTASGMSVMIGMITN
jgi:hypothetical protein